MKKFLILALSAALLLAFFGCGSPKEKEPEGPPAGTENFEEIALTLPDSTSAAKADTGENNSNMYKFSTEDSAKIKGANPGSRLAVTYQADVDYAVGEIGWLDKANAGPVISGDGSKKKQTAYIDVVFLADVFGEDNSFTIHIFNGAKLIEVMLMAAPDDYDYKGNDKATTGATPIFIPFGHKLPGNGDLSKADFKRITTATTGKVVFYFDIEEENKDYGILKFGPKCGDPYKHYGISKAGEIIDGDDGWRAVAENIGTKTIEYTVAEIQAGVKAAGASYNKLEINMGKADAKKADLLYIELKP